MKNGNITRVKGARQLAKVTARLQREGYFVPMPSYKRRATAKGGAKPFCTDEFVKNQLCGCQEDGKGAKREVPLMFASSGNENMTGAEKIGTKGLGWIEWGWGNRWPNVCALLTMMLPYTAAGWKFNTDLIAGQGPQPLYRYTQYVGGNMTEKLIPFRDAGTYLRGRIAELKQQPDTEERDLLLKDLNYDYDKWKETNEELEAFCENNDLQAVMLALAADQSMFSISFPELLLNQQQLDENGKPVPTERWTPKVTGIRARPCHTCRFERMDEGNKINYLYVSNQWYDDAWKDKLKQASLVTAAYPLLDRFSPLQDLREHILKARTAKVKTSDRPSRFMMTTAYPSPGKPYYPAAPWHSIFGGSIYEMASIIFDDRLTRKRNKNVIGRVIYIHHDYIQSMLIQQDGENPKKQEEIVDEVFEDINTWLANPDNSGQSLLAYNFMGPDGKEHKSFEVVEIESNDKKTAEANEKELQELSSIIFFAMGTDSKLIGNTPGDTSSSGGTDLRERLLIKQVMQSPTINLVLKPLEIISRFNEWDKHLVWKVKREVLTTLDNSKTGVTESVQA